MTLPNLAESREVEGFVLAGGESSRMGRDKALLEFAGEPLIVRALTILRNAGLQPAIAGARSSLSAFAPVIEDTTLARRGGPLSGIYAALTATQARYAIFLPVDMPFVPSALVAYMVVHALTSASPVCIPSVNGRRQTFPSVVDRRVLPYLERRLTSGERGTLSAFEHAASGLARSLSVLPVEFLVQTGQVAHPFLLPPALWFLNINASRDLMRAQGLASGRSE